MHMYHHTQEPPHTYAHTHTHSLFFSELFKNKLHISYPLTPKYFSVYWVPLQCLFIDLLVQSSFVTFTIKHKVDIDFNYLLYHHQSQHVHLSLTSVDCIITPSIHCNCLYPKYPPD